MALSAGARLGPYEILGPLGAGGMGEVYRARDSRLGREVAVKVLPRELAIDRDRLLRFEQEARAVSALNHPHIVTLHEIGESPSGPYIVLEKIEGKSLRELLRGGALPVKRVLTIGAQIAEGLAKAHAAGIVHRDVKPENVMVTEDGFAKILDFGLAKLAYPELESVATAQMPTGTASGMILGTIGYLSPEQAQGGAADFRSDQFALGALMYELAVGEQPFRRGSAVESLSAVINEEPEPLCAKRPHLPPQLGWFVERCLAKDPNDRYDSTRDLWRELANLRDHLSELLRSDIAVSAGSRFGWSGARWKMTGVAVAAVIAGYFASDALRDRRNSTPPAPTALSFERFTQLPGQESEPTISPDGKSVVYVRDGHLWLLRVGGTNARDLTPDSATNFAPSFSPDGQSIAFHSERDDGGVYVMGATGENVRRVTSRGFRPAWTPDGKELVVSAFPTASGFGGLPSRGLDAVDVATGKHRRLCECVALGPAVSPRGDQVVFLGVDPTGSAQRDLWTVPLSGLAPGESPLRLTDDPAYDWDPQWSPDDVAIEYVSTRGGSANLWRLPLDANSGRASGPAVPLSLPSTSIGFARASADGRTRVFQADSRSSVLRRADFDPRKGGQLSEPREALRLGESIFGLYGPQNFSPGDDVIAVQGGPINDDVVLRALDGSAARTLVTGPYRNRAPAWSPDGRTIAFGSDRGGRYEIWSIGADGGDLRRLLAAGLPLYSPDWSPDGSRLLAFEVDATGRSRAVVHQLGDPSDRYERLPELPGGGFLGRAIWSRSGDAIFGSDGSRGLWKWSFADRTYRRLPMAAGGDIHSELLDGSLVFVSENRAANHVEVLSLNPVSGRTRVLLTVPGSYRPGLSLDRRQRTLWILRWEEEADLWIARSGEPPR